jgi:transposase
MSGGYVASSVLELWQARLSCALINPRSVRRYAEAMEYLEKTDRIDAAVSVLVS